MLLEINEHRSKIAKKIVSNCLLLSTFVDSINVFDDKHLRGAQWLWVGVEGSLVRDFRMALFCVIEQDTLSSA